MQRGYAVIGQKVSWVMFWVDRYPRKLNGRMIVDFNSMCETSLAGKLSHSRGEGKRHLKSESPSEQACIRDSLLAKQAESPG
jgi:hypothetical protein